MAGFTADPGLELKVANMIAPGVRQYANEVQKVARQLAPPTKRWVHVGDHEVRDTHRSAPGRAENQGVPGNLRFGIESMRWDMVDPKSNHVGPVTWMTKPHDKSSGAVANILNCRCIATYDHEEIRRNIRVGPTLVSGTAVRVVVSATGNRIVASEFGETYPGGRGGMLKADGVHFMGRAARAAAYARFEL